MSITEAIAQHIIDVHEGENWTEVTIKETLSDVTVYEATKVPAFTPNNIAALLFHITFYSNIADERLKGNNPQIDEHNGFNVPALKTEDDWLKLKEDNLQAARKLAEAIRQTHEAKLFEPIVINGSSTYKTLHGIAEHAHYHLGQMMLIKKWIRSGSK